MYEGYEKLISKIDQYRKDLPVRLENDVLEQVAEEMQKSIRNRIFRDGKDSKGNLIAKSYGEKPISVQKKIFIKPSAFKGKKSMKLEHGYKELREIQGLETDKVNLEYSGELKESLKVRKRNISIIVGFSDKNNARKARKLEKQYDKIIFKPSKEERIENLKKIRTKLRKIQREYFYG